MIHCFWWIFVLFLLEQLPEVKGKTAEACYGTDLACDYYSLRCAEDEIIRLETLRYRRKEQSTCQEIETGTHCKDKEVCCSLDESDCSAQFDLGHTYEAYTNCSGRQNCTNVHSPWSQMSCGGAYKLSTYVSLQYECEKVETKLKFCGGSTRTGSEIEAIFDGTKESFDPLKASRECSCRVTNNADAQTVRLGIIDMRLQRLDRSNENSTAECSSAKFRMSGFFDNRCIASTNHERDNFMYREDRYGTIQAGSSVEILLTDLYLNGHGDSPAMIWISLHAENSKKLQVYCREIIPLTTTTMTTTSTTTTTTPTTTSTSTTTTIPTTATTTPTTTTTSTTTTTTTPTTTSTTTTTPTTTTTTTTTPTTTTSTTTTTTIPTTTTSTTTTTPTTTRTTPTTTTSTSTTTTTPTTTTSTTTPTTTSTTTSLPTTTTTTSTTSPTTTTATSTTTSATSATTPTILTTTSPAITTTKLTSITAKATSSRSTSTTSKKTTESILRTTKIKTSPTEKDSTVLVITPTSTSSKERTTFAAPIIGGGDSKDDQKRKLFLAIFVPLAVLGLIIGVSVTWLYLRAKHPKKDLRMHKTFVFRRSDDELIEKYIMKRRSLEIQPTDSVLFADKSLPITNIRPMSSIKAVPNSLPDVYSSPLYDMPTPNHIPTSFLPVSSNDADTNQPIHVKLGFVGNGSPPNSFYSSDTKTSSEIKQPYVGGIKVQDAADTNIIMNDSVDKVHKMDNQTSKPPSENGIVIHVDNTTGLTKMKPTSNGGIYQNEEPAVIVPEVENKRTSGAVNVLPGDSPDDYAALYIKL